MRDRVQRIQQRELCDRDVSIGQHQLERNEHAVVVAALRIVGSRQALFIQQRAHAERERWITVRAVLDLIGVFGKTVVVVDQRRLRSEEHTSELQSLMRISYAVFCLKTNIRTAT